MFQSQINKQISQAQATAVENTKRLAQAVLQSAQELAEINQAVANEILVAAQKVNTHLMAIKDPQRLAKLAQPEVAQEAAKYATAYQGRVRKVIRNSGNEIKQVIDLSIANVRNDLEKFVIEATKSSPSGSEAFVTAFTAVFETSLQYFDQVHSVANDAFSSYGKSVDAALESAQDQYVVAKPGAKDRKTA
ncbi:phasin family protein [Polynucleobacter sp. AP-Reno-20A-A9]|uniref:phasin family protein n=1 Tax=Polynucleobacter sp. AP-Reno-20A-A9 TaxID=2576925 RepID=UPI001C0E4D02|nr:phasin family protein [Polynucleobacter sp. AP-Reno-20A-A9]MBU3628850.1 phasin family protein [Polynucleobacter sp. AP-Reno-20A-A9]